MRTPKLFFIIIFILIGLKNNAQELKLNKEKSVLNWTGKAASSSYSLTGTLKPRIGVLKIEGNTITSLKVIIDMKSLYHENEDLKKHLRGEDFFEVKSFTEASFEILVPVKTENTKANITGEMTIKDITKKEVIDIAIIENKISFECKINRTQYGVKFNSPSFFKKMKENAIADEFIIKGELFFE